MTRALFIAATLFAAQVGAARGITSKELLGTWLTGATGADNVYCTFRSDLTYDILRGEEPWVHGTWKLLDGGKKLEMTDSSTRSSGVTIIRRFEGRFLHITVSNGVEGAWKKVRRVPRSKHGRTQT